MIRRVYTGETPSMTSESYEACAVQPRKIHRSHHKLDPVTVGMGMDYILAGPLAGLMTEVIRCDLP